MSVFNGTVARVSANFLCFHTRQYSTRGMLCQSPGGSIMPYLILAFLMIGPRLCQAKSLYALNVTNQKSRLVPFLQEAQVSGFRVAVNIQQRLVAGRLSCPAPDAAIRPTGPFGSTTRAPINLCQISPITRSPIRMIMMPTITRSGSIRYFPYGAIIPR